MRTFLMLGTFVAILCAPRTTDARQVDVSAVERRLMAARAWVSLSELTAHTRFLAGDPLYGRAPGSQGAAVTEHYIAAHFERIGLQPGAQDGSYFQRIPLLGVRPSPVVTLTMGANTFSLNFPFDFVARPARADTFLMAGGELTFAGYGVHAAQLDWDDYKRTPVSGHVLLVLPGVPDLIADATHFASDEYKIQEAVQRGATGILFVHTPSTTATPWVVLRNRWTRELVQPLETQNVGLDFIGWITSDAAKRIFAQGGIDFDVLVRRASLKEFRPVETDAHVSIDIESEVRSFEASNVVGTIPGYDVPERSLLITTHHDYLGVRRGAFPDSIYNGARANAANLAGMLAMASSLTAAGVVAPTTIKFVAATGGESGAIGLQSFVWGLSTTGEALHAAVVLEEANVWGPTSDIAIGGPREVHRNAVIASAARAEGLTVVAPGDRQQAQLSTAGTRRVLMNAGVPFATIAAGSTLPDGAPSARDLAMSAFYDRSYGRTSDNFLSEFDFQGLQSQVRFAIRLTWALAQPRRAPTN